MAVEALAPVPVALPLLAAAVLVASAPVIPELLTNVIAVAISGAATLACAALLAGSANGPIVYWFGGWARATGWRWASRS